MALCLSLLLDPLVLSGFEGSLVVGGGGASSSSAKESVGLAGGLVYGCGSTGGGDCGLLHLWGTQVYVIHKIQK